MRKFWTGVARFLAVLACIGFALAALLALALVNVDRRLLNAATYKDALSSRQVYARLPRLIAEQLTMPVSFNPCEDNPFRCENVTPEFMDCVLQAVGQERYNALSTGQDQPTQPELDQARACARAFGPASQPAEDQQGGPPAFMQSLTVADWEAVITALLPPEELKPMAESVLDQIFAFLDGKQDVVTVPLTELKRRIAGQGGLEAVLALIRAQPPCTEEQLLQMQGSLDGDEGETVLCRPTEEQLQAMIPQIESQLQAVVAGIPEEATLLTPEFGENSAQPGPLGNGPAGGLRLARLLMRLSPDLALLFLLFVSLFGVRSAKGWLRWWGTPFLAAGVTAAVTAISSAASFEQAWLQFLAGRMPAYLTLGTSGLIHDLLQAIFGAFMAGIRNDGLLLGLLGLVMVIGSFFVRSKRPPAEADEARTQPEPAPTQD